MDESKEGKFVTQLIITLHKDGRIDVNGPIGDKILSYGLLEVAKDEIKKFHEISSQKNIEVVKNGNGILDFARRLK